MSHRSEDSKLLVIKNYLKSNKTQEELAEIFDVSTRTIRRWLRKYEETKTINRKTRLHLIIIFLINFLLCN